MNKWERKLYFQKNKGKLIKRGTIALSVILLIVGVIYITYSKFESNKEFTLINGKVVNNKDLSIIAIYQGDNKVNEIPEKNSEWVFDKAECSNGATASWNNDSWKLELSLTTPTKCTLYFKEKPYSDNTGASIPELYQGLVPVKYVNNEIVIASTSEEWYNYANHEWANAVIPTSAARTKTAGQTLSESEIQQMYVWIPRYRYKLWNAENGSSNEQMINIEFEDKNTTKSTGSTNGTWLTHPAFTFGSTELNGIWVGKFETSGSATAINIKPNVSSLTGLSVGNAFNASRNIELTYASNFNLNQNEIDTHMMKNMEWGAVAYLSHSKYGRLNSDGTCVSGGCKIWINNNKLYTTGCSGASVSASETASCNQWNTTNGMHASTTDNMYGVYDMSGGAYEYVMGNVAQNTTTYTYTASSSGLSTMPEAKYIDTYTNSNSSNTNHASGKLGDATKETLKTFGNTSGGWYSDYAYFPLSSFVWFRRGGGYNSGYYAGAFNFFNEDGNANSSYSFRVVLSAQ